MGRYSLLADEEDARQDRPAYTSFQAYKHRLSQFGVQTMIGAGLLVLGLIYTAWSWSTPSFSRPSAAYVGTVNWRNSSIQSRLGYRMMDREQCEANFHPLYL